MPTETYSQIKIFDDDLIRCTIDMINLVDKKSVKKPILALTRTIICPKSKFFAISKIANKGSESACNISADLPFIASCHKTGAEIAASQRT